MMLPALKVFVHGETWKLSLSYLPLQLIKRFPREFDRLWQQVLDNSVRLLMDTSPKGIAPDWISWADLNQFKATSDDQRIGSYDAIRVYLWVGMLAGDEPHADLLRSHFLRIGERVSPRGQVAEKTVVSTAQGSSWGGHGFSAALLPLLKGYALESPLIDNTKIGLESTMGYYNQMLTLFGYGWFENRYRFDRNGYLVLPWANC